MKVLNFYELKLNLACGRLFQKTKLVTFLLAFFFYSIRTYFFQFLVGKTFLKIDKSFEQRNEILYKEANFLLESEILHINHF